MEALTDECEFCGDMVVFACVKHRFITSAEVTTTKTCPVPDERSMRMCGELLVRNVECPRCHRI